MHGNTRTHNLPLMFTFQMDVTTAGTPEQLAVKYNASTISFADNDPAADSIADSAGQFLIAGFQRGDRITVSGSGSNDGTYTIESVTASAITIASREALTTEAAGSSITLTAPKKVPDGVTLDIKAKNGNSGNIHLANSSARADSDNTTGSAFTLRANEDLEVQVSRTDKIWVDTTNSGDGVEVAFEQNDPDL